MPACYRIQAEEIFMNLYITYIRTVANISLKFEFFIYIKV